MLFRSIKVPILMDQGVGPGQYVTGANEPDAELLGCPVRVTVGRRSLAAGELEVMIRRGLEQRSVPLEGASEAVAAVWRGAP